MEHINSFQKGLTKDTTIILQPDGTYRHMVNCTLVSQDGNYYAVKDCLGNVLTFTINSRYTGSVATLDIPAMPIGFISFPDKLIVLSTNSTTGGYGEIGEIKYLPYGEGVQPDIQTGQFNAGYIPLYHHASLNFSKAKRVEGLGFGETTQVQRIYWTDNFNNPRVFNTSDSVYTTYILSGSLVVTSQYMVLEGGVEHPVGSGSFYGPGLPLGNIFTAATTFYTNLTGASPAPKVIKYVPYQLLDFTPSRSLGNIKFSEFGTGNVYCGNKMYFYRLGREDGVFTSWSPGSYMVAVGTLNIPYDTTVYDYHNYDGAGSASTLIDSKKSVFVTVENIDLIFDFIQVACAEFDQALDVPRKTSIVAQQTITGATMSIEHTGRDNLGLLTNTDLLLFPASITKCKTIATSKNYLLVGNVTERQEIEWDVSGATVSSFQYPMPCHTNPDVCGTGGIIYDPLSPVSGANPVLLDPDTRWLVTSIAGGVVVYNAVNYTVGQVITATVAGGPVVIIPAGSQIRPCVTLNRYTTSGGVRRENAIELKGDSCFWDYKSAAAQSHVASYWSDETYRVAAVAFDTKGNPFYAKHIADYKMPDINTKGGLILDHTSTYSLNPSLLKINNLSIPADIIDQMSGFSIVRAVRDPRIITQGLVTQVVTDGASPATYNPGGYIPVSKDAKAVVSKSYAFLCPDSLVDNPMKSSFGVIGDTMEDACWLNAFNFNGTQRVRAEGGKQQVYSKIITPLSGDTSARTGTITYFSFVDEGRTVPNITTAVSFNNNLQLGAGTAPEDSCLTTGAYNIDTFRGAGGKKIVFGLDADFKHYSSVNGYSSVAANTQTQKILMNYVKSGTFDPYGGTSESSLASTVYISTGHFQPITSSVKSDTYDGISAYVFDNIEIGGGDCFPCLIDEGYGLWDNTYAPSTYSYSWFFPCECNSNYNLRKGRKTSNVGMYFTNSGDGPAGADTIVYTGPAAEVRLEDYSYNYGYSSERLGTGLGYLSLPVNFINSSEFKFRVRYAGIKFIGEKTDSWRTFGVNDYKDIDGNGGEINNIKVKDGRVIVWQNKITSTVPILERQLLSASLGAPTSLGTGGVVDRYDPLTSYFGNQHQWSLIETEYGFCWFDMRRKAFMIMTVTGGITEASQVQGLKGFFDEIFLEAIGNNVIDPDNLLNSPTFAATSDQPLMGTGITGVYDPKFKMTYMTFKFKARKVINVGGSRDAFWSKDFTIGYLHSETTRCFIGQFDFTPAISHNHNQFVISVNNPKNTTQYISDNLTNFSFVVGETLAYGYNTEYICIANVTLNTLDNYPDGISGATYWLLINSTNQLWVHSQPAIMGQTTAPDYLGTKFFGKVWPNEIQYVINPKTQNPFEVTHYEMQGNSALYTDVYISAGTQSASDNNIKPWNKYYRYIVSKLCANFPISSTGRIVNSYLLVRLVKKNYDTNPTTLIDSPKILQYVHSFLQEKR